MSTGQHQQDHQSAAQAAYAAGAYARAAELFAAAVQDLQNQGNPLLAAEMRNNQSVALLQAGDGQAAWQAAQGTDLVFAQAGDTHRQALALGNQAAALDKFGKWKQAIEKYEQAADLLKNSGDEELRRYTLQSLSALQLKHSRYFEAMANTQSSLTAKPKLTVQDRFLRWLIRIVFNLLHRPPAF